MKTEIEKLKEELAKRNQLLLLTTNQYNSLLNQYNEIWKAGKENEELKELNKKICEDWEKEIKVYWNALEEIKNDLKEVCKEECDYTKSKFCGDCDCRYGQILTKINEVLK